MKEKGLPMVTFNWHRKLLPLSLASLLAACAVQTPPPAQVVAPPPPPPPVVVSLSPIHTGLSPLETVWHLRAGLNVAALGCQTRSGPEIVSAYNSLLARQKAVLKAAYDAKAERYRSQGGNWQRALDTHMTRLYNHFASPDAQARFCTEAMTVAREALAASPESFELFAAEGLRRIDRPIALAANGTGMMAAVANSVEAASGGLPQRKL